MSYATVDELKYYLQIDGQIIIDDTTLLQPFLNSAQQVIENYTHRIFNVDVGGTPETRIYRLWQEMTFQSRTIYPSLLLDRDLFQLNQFLMEDDTVIDPSWYRLYPYNDPPYWALEIQEFGSSLLNQITDVVKVEGFWGYSETPPQDVVHSEIRLAAHFYRQKDTQVTDFDTVITSPSGVLMVPSAIPKDVMKILDPYKARHNA